MSDYGPNEVPLWSPTGARGLLSNLFGNSFHLCLSLQDIVIVADVAPLLFEVSD